MRLKFGICAALLSCIPLACTESRNPAAPAETSAAPQQVRSPDGPSINLNSGPRILMLDQCEPDSFNAAAGPGTCINRNGGLGFDTFIALLQKHGTVPSWRFSPDTIHVPAERTLPIVNAGGEVHTFTPVEAFGGGIVPDLNALSGNPVPAPECLVLAGSDFIPSGAQTTRTFQPDAAGKFQCCIHPWMRAETR